jgi:hypothetical protein
MRSVTCRRAQRVLSVVQFIEFQVLAWYINLNNAKSPRGGGGEYRKSGEIARNAASQGGSF